MADAHKNFSYSTVLTAPSPATSGTSLVVQSGDGAKFPAVSFNATVWPAGSRPTTTNAEIVRVTAISTDTFTITRTQESTSARTIVVGDQIAATVTVKSFTDIETQYATLASPTFTGTPAAPTAAAKTNTTQLATTAYVDTGQDGWILDTDTWVFVSATSFKITGADRTAKFPKGTKVSYNDGAVDYGYVASATFSTDTTVTLIQNDTYSIANATLTAPRISYVDRPQLFPSFLPYTITVAGITSPPASVARFSIDNGKCFYSLYPAMPSAANKNGTAATWTITLPIAVSASAQNSFIVCAVQHGTIQNQPGFVYVATSATTAALYRDLIQTTWTSGTAVDSFFMMIAYEI